MGTSPRARTRRAVLAVGIAAGLHGAAMLGLDQMAWWEGRIPLPTLPSSAAPPPTIIANAAAIDLIDLQVPALTIEAVMGAGDSVGITGSHPLPNASANLPGRNAADRGGGASGGPATWTGRRDKLDDVALRAESWNDGRDYRTAHRDVDRAPRSPEALQRAPKREYGDRQAVNEASGGDAAASLGNAATGTGAGQGELPSWRDADPIFDLPAGRTTPARTAGAPQATREAALATIGPRSDDVQKRGRAGDDRAVAAASSERSPDPFDWTQPRSGATDGEGVAGRAAPGMLRDGRGRGDAATTASASVGGADLSVTAERQDPYFRNLYRQLDRLVEFPRDLAIALQSGWVVGIMTVSPEGRITAISIERSSGEEGFDGALTGALRQVSLGRVPPRLLDGHRALRVRIPYTFRNPLVR